MVLYSPDWTNTGFSFILLTVNLFRHSTLTEQGLYLKLFNQKQHSSTMKSTITQVLLFHKRYVYPFPVILEPLAC